MATENLPNTGKVDDDLIARPFDQTNGLADDSGDSDGTAESDTKSAAQREGDDRDDDLGTVPPIMPAGPAGGRGQ